MEALRPAPMGQVPGGPDLRAAGYYAPARGGCGRVHKGAGAPARRRP
jgi:hypothetical protein